MFQFLKDDGATRLFYCNVNTPPAMEGDALTYIDLDIDILVEPDLSYQVLDLDDFTPEELTEVLDTAEAMKEVLSRPIKRGRKNCSLFHVKQLSGSKSS